MPKLKTTTKQEQRKACKFDPQRLKSQKGYKPKGLIFKFCIKTKKHDMSISDASSLQ